MANQKIKDYLEKVEAFKKGIIESVNTQNSDSDAKVKAQAILEALKQQNESYDGTVEDEVEINPLDKELEELKEVMNGITEDEEAELEKLADEIVNDVETYGDAEADVESGSVESDVESKEDEVVEESDDEIEFEIDDEEISMEESEDEVDMEVSDVETMDSEDEDPMADLAKLEMKKDDYEDKLTDELMEELIGMEDFDELVADEDEDEVEDVDMEEGYGKFMEMAQKLEACGKGVTAENMSIASLFGNGEAQLDESMVEKYVEKYNAKDESMSRNYTVGKGMNKKDEFYPKELTRMQEQLSERDKLIGQLVETNQKMENALSEVTLWNDKLSNLISISTKHDLNKHELGRIAEAFEKIDSSDKLSQFYGKLDEKYTNSKENFEKNLKVGTQIIETKTDKVKIVEKKSYDDTSEYVERFKRLVNFK